MSNSPQACLSSLRTLATRDAVATKVTCQSPHICHVQSTRPSRESDKDLLISRGLQVLELRNAQHHVHYHDTTTAVPSRRPRISLHHSQGFPDHPDSSSYSRRRASQPDKHQRLRDEGPASTHSIGAPCCKHSRHGDGRQGALHCNHPRITVQLDETAWGLAAQLKECAMLCQLQLITSRTSAKDAETVLRKNAAYNTEHM